MRLVPVFETSQNTGQLLQASYSQIHLTKNFNFDLTTKVGDELLDFRQHISLIREIP